MAKKKLTLDVSDLRQEFIASEDMNAIASSRQEIMEQVISENKELLKKISELESIIANFSKTPTLINSHVKPEELICMEQIQILQSTSRQRELTLDEVKKLDILIKNQRILQSQPVDNQNDWREVSEADLVAIASKKDN